MSETVLVAVLSFAGTLIGTVGGILAANRLTTYRLERLEKQVEKHNQVIDRVYKLEQADAVEEEEIKVINHRIRDLEQYHKGGVSV
ncbi:MAG: hypothetical protein E7552_02640 [Ruminococcaceae bacterium]|nr:hypothetical protein [Oscillospiraceae bacterium]